MDVQDILFSSTASLELKAAVLELCHQHSLSAYTKVVTPTATNDDVNGSQHARNGGTDFTYQDAVDTDLDTASSLGYYEYFSTYGNCYTGHYYNGEGDYFEAIVLDPPAYASEITV